MTSLGSITNLGEKKERGREEIERKKGIREHHVAKKKRINVYRRQRERNVLEREIYIYI